MREGCHLGDGQEQVGKVILVQLQHVDRHAEGVLAAVAVQDVEQLGDAARGQARHLRRAIDGVSFSRPCLPVCKDAHIVAVHRRLDKVPGVLEDLHPIHF